MTLEPLPRSTVYARDHVELGTVTAEDAWRIYDLVAARTEALEAAELTAMRSMGGEDWRLLRRRLRHRLPMPVVPSEQR